MPDFSGRERRKSERFVTDLDIQFHVSFDIETKIDYRVLKSTAGKPPDNYFPAVGRNVSVEGLCFVSDKLLNGGDHLSLNVFVPSSNEPILMEGQVKWSQPCSAETAGGKYETGVKISSVRGESVERSIFIDKVHNILWSNVLETVFSSFKTLVIKQQRQKPPASF